MTSKRKFWQLPAALLAGFLWAYSFTTRIGLLFIIPLWLKLIVLLSLSINLTMLGYYLYPNFLKALRKNKLWFWILIGSTALSSLIFILAPYQRVPFRTTHTLQIDALESEVIISAIYSPDDNLMDHTEFMISDGVTFFDEAGFRLSPASNIKYEQAHTGKLTLFFMKDSGPVNIFWDGQQQIITPQTLQEKAPSRFRTWHISSGIESSIIRVTLPGNTWGQPDTIWKILGGLLPIGDFFTLTTLALGLSWLVIALKQKPIIQAIQWRLVKVWVDALLCVTFALIMIRVGFPEFIPFWFLLFYIPAMMYLLYHQTKFFIENEFIKIRCFSKISQYLHTAGSFLKKINRERWVFLIAIMILAILSAVIQLHLTSPGMGISGDSVHYLEGAKNLAAGKGYVLEIAEGDPEPITGFEPVYSTLLSTGILLGVEAQQFARYVNTLLISLTMLMVGWIIFRTTGRVLPTIIGTSFLLLSPLILNIYSWAMSEPLFIVFLLTTLLIWFWHINKPSIWKALLTGLSASLIINTRLAGVVFLTTFAFNTLLFEKSKFKIRVRDTFLMGVAAFIPFAAFFIRNQIVTKNSPGSQTVALGTFPKEYWETIGQEISSWFKWQNYFNYQYERYNALFVSLGVVLLLVVLWLVFKKRLSVKNRTDPVVIFVLISIPVYMAAIILNTVFLTADPTVSGLIRYMIPILLLLMILISKLFSTCWRQPLLSHKLVIMFIIMTSLQIYITDATKIIREQPLLYRNYTDRKNQCGDEIAPIINENPEVSIFTNNCEYFYFMTGQRCRILAMDENAYRSDGEIYQAVKNGAIVTMSEGFGSNPPGVQDFLRKLDRFDSGCYLNFYQWTDD
ncbi:MAG: hypothetical protein U9R53_10620 [Chloroflexota bacterium]|nr:hypothetical protein [Chloroflexota bacterium]